MKTLIHPALSGHPEIREATSRILDRVQTPLVDTWGCTHQGHLTTIIERLGLVSTEIQNVTDQKGMPGAERNYREDLTRQLAELGANVLVMLAEELETLRHG